MESEETVETELRRTCNSALDFPAVSIYNFAKPSSKGRGGSKKICGAARLTLREGVAPAGGKPRFGLLTNARSQPVRLIPEK